MKKRTKMYQNAYNYSQKMEGKLIILETQKKEFINYLEEETSKWHNNYDNYNYEYEIEEPTAEELIKKILQKYKEIMGLKKWKKK